MMVSMILLVRSMLKFILFQDALYIKKYACLTLVATLVAVNTEKYMEYLPGRKVFDNEFNMSRNIYKLYNTFPR